MPGGGFNAAVRLPRGKAGERKARPDQQRAKAESSPRTPWGDPDLQGTWFVLADVPLERSAANAGKEFLTDQEVAAADEKKGLNPGRNARSADKSQDVSGAYNAVFNSVLKTGKRTSMIIDPPDGKIPPLVARRSRRPQIRSEAGSGWEHRAANDNPETIAQSPRCLGVPMPFLPLNTLFAQGTVMQVVQSPKSMGIYMEDDHAGGGNRVIFMDGRPHASFETEVLPGRLARPLGRKHAGRGNNEFFAGLSRIQHRDVQDDRALHARGREYFAARNHFRRSQDLDQALDRCHRDGQGPR